MPSADPERGKFVPQAGLFAQNNKGKSKPLRDRICCLIIFLKEQALAELINLHVIQVRRYESGASQPTLDVIRRLAIALQVSADVLIFGADERGPDGDLQLQFEAISKFAPEEKQIIKALLEGMILKHEAKRWSSAA